MIKRFLKYLFRFEKPIERSAIVMSVSNQSRILKILVEDHHEEGVCEKTGKEGPCVQFRMGTEPSCIVGEKEFLQTIAFEKKKAMKRGNENVDGTVPLDRMAMERAGKAG